MANQQLFIRLVSLEEAKELIEKRIPPKPLGIEEIVLEEALGRVLAEDIYSPISYPPYPRSIVDGYAVRSSDVARAWEDNPVELRVKGELRIGMPPGSISIGEGEAVYVDTGSPVPGGADSVVPVEYTKRLGDRVLVYRSTSVGENIAWPGSDVVRGEKLVPKGTRITAYHVGVLANVGIRKVRVYSKPRIAIISTGDELVEPGKPLTEGRVYDSNSFLLKALVERDGFKADRLGVVGDNEKELEELLLKALEEYDVVLLSGGTSAGIGDIVYRVLGRMGDVIVHGLKLKPGKPTVIANVKGKPVFGLPGNPGSTRNVYEVLVKPYLKRLEGEIHGIEEEYVEAELALPVHGAGGRRTYQPVILVYNRYRKTISAYPYEYESYMIRRVLEADGILVIGEDEYAPIEPGSKRRVLLLRKPRENIVVGEESALLCHIAEKEKLTPLPQTTTTALIALGRGDAGIAVISSLVVRGQKLPENADVVEKAKRKILLVGYARRETNPRIAWYSPGTGISMIQQEVYEKIRGKHVKVKIRGPLHAKLLLLEGQVDYALLPEEYVPGERGLTIEEVGLEELLVVKRTRS